jgi:hypothetical protein
MVFDSKNKIKTQKQEAQQQKQKNIFNRSFVNQNCKTKYPTTVTVVVSHSRGDIAPPFGSTQAPSDVHLSRSSSSSFFSLSWYLPAKTTLKSSSTTHSKDDINPTRN